MAKYIIDIPDEVPVSDGCVPFDMCRPSWYSDAYEKGKSEAENEVWDFAKKMVSMSGNEMSDIWGCTTNFGEVIHNTTYSEAKAKYEDWKKSKEEIRVGDELINHLGKPYIIYHIDRDSAYGVDVSRGYPLSQEVFPTKNYIPNKTGRYFPEIVELTKKMGESDED